MRNFFIFLFISFFCALVIYFVGNSLLQGSLESRLKSVPEEMSRLGVIIETPSFQSLKVNSSKSLSIKNIQTRFSFTNKELFSAEESFSIAAAEVIFEAKDSSYKKLKLTLKELTIQSIPNDKLETSSFDLIDSYDSIKFDFISTEFENADSNPEIATRALLSRFANYLKSGRLEIPVQFLGTAVLNRGSALRLKLAEDFEIEKSSFDKLADYHLSQTEIDFLAQHPLRVGTILELRQQSIEFSNKVSNSGAEADAVSFINFIINIKRKFGQQAETLFNQYLSDEKRKFYLEMANDYYNKRLSDGALIALINEQGKNFPVKPKASYSVN